MNTKLQSKHLKIYFSLLDLLATPNASVTRKDLINKSGIDKSSLCRIILNREIYKKRTLNGKNN